jgi:hypothetical protein
MSDPGEPASDLEVNVAEAKRLYSAKLYRDCIQVLEGSLSDAASHGPVILAELHLLLAKCYRGLDELKNAILGPILRSSFSSEIIFAQISLPPRTTGTSSFLTIVYPIFGSFQGISMPKRS